MNSYVTHNRTGTAPSFEGAFFRAILRNERNIRSSFPRSVGSVPSGSVPNERSVRTIVPQFPRSVRSKDDRSFSVPFVHEARRTNGASGHPWSFRWFRSFSDPDERTESRTNGPGSPAGTLGRTPPERPPTAGAGGPARTGHDPERIPNRDSITRSSDRARERPSLGHRDPHLAGGVS